MAHILVKIAFEVTINAAIVAVGLIIYDMIKFR